MLDLAAGQTIAGSDVKLNYSGWGQLRAVSVGLSKNLYANRLPNIVSTDCIDGISQAPYYTSCSSYNNGEVEVAQVLEGSGNVFTGPLSGSLFNVTFNIKGNVTSLFTIPVALLINPGYGGPNAYPIQYVPLAGVFSNTGVTAFFNYQPLSPPTILPGGNVSFDARDSFDADNLSNPIVSYSWNFGDGSSPGIGNQTSHLFQAPGNYSVQLTVKDTKSLTGVLVRVVEVLRTLGSLHLTVRNNFGSNVPSAIVQVFNSSSGPRVYNMTTNLSGTVFLVGLLPGDYLVKVSGARIENQSKTEHIIPGWQVTDTIFVTQIAPPNNPSPPDYSTLIYLGIILGSVAVFASLLVWQRFRKRRNAV
jgi:hypothetical protein